MNHTRAGRKPLHVAHPKARRRTERVGMIDVSMAHDGDRLEATVGMLRKSGHDVAVVHTPTIVAFEILADVPPDE